MDKKVLLAIAAADLVVPTVSRTTWGLRMRADETRPPDDDHPKRSLPALKPEPLDDAAKERLAKAEAKRERRRARNRTLASQPAHASEE